MVVSRRLPLTAVVVLASFAAAGCKRSGTPATGPDGTPPGDARAAGAAGAQPPRPAPAGMKAPFERRTAALAKTFAAAVKAYRSGKYGAAEQLFHEVVVARPDDTAARYQELRAAVRADPDADPAGAPARAASSGLRGVRPPPANRQGVRAALGLTARERAGGDPGRSARRLRRRARARRLLRRPGTAPAQPVMYDETSQAGPRALTQEAYAFDPASGLVRRLSDTAGRVAGIEGRPRRQAPGRAHRERAHAGRGRAPA